MKKITKSQMNAYTKSCKQNAEIILNLPDDKTAVVTVDTAPNIAVAQEIIDQTVRMTLENGEYHPERLPYVFFALVLNYLTNIDVPVTEDGIVDMEVVYQWYVGTPLMTELTNISKINELYWMADDKLNFKKEKVLRHSKLDDVLDQAMKVMQTLQDEDFRTSIETLAKTIPVA